MAILVVFWGFLGAQMGELSPIDFGFGLCIDIDVNDGQNRFGVRISEHLAGIANFWPRVGRLPFWHAAF